MVVHYAGVGCEMDAAHGHRGTPRPAGHRRQRPRALRRLRGPGRSAASAPPSTLSFHETKNLTCGEGGALVINDPALVDAGRDPAREGHQPQPVLPRPGRQVHLGRHRLELSAVGPAGGVPVGAARGPRTRFRPRRHAIWRRYDEALAGLGRGAQGVGRPQRAAALRRTRPTCTTCCCRRSRRARGLIAHLRAREILAVFHYQPLHLSDKGREYGGRAGPVSGHRRRRRSAGAAAAFYLDLERGRAGPRHRRGDQCSRPSYGPAPVLGAAAGAVDQPRA